jgi:RNA polymerase sigma factor (sigma-70 family)
MSDNTNYANYTDSELINLIKKDADFLKHIYNKTKSLCIKFMQKQCNGVDLIEIEDIYHDSLIVLHNKAKSDNFQLTCNLQTYLNSICRNQLLNQFKQSGKIISFPDNENRDDDNHDDNLYDLKITDWLPYNKYNFNEENDFNDDRIKAIMSGLEKMKSIKGNCYDLLSHIYWKKTNIDEIAKIFNYKDNQNARNTSFKCREKLKSLTFKALNNIR